LFHHSEKQTLDPASFTTMAAMRVSLSLLEAMRETSPKVFERVCQGLMNLLQVTTQSLYAEPSHLPPALYAPPSHCDSFV
jgi:hypothetical protein